VAVVVSIALGGLHLTHKQAEVTHVQLFRRGHAKVCADLADRLRVFFAVLAHNPDHLGLLDQRISFQSVCSSRSILAWSMQGVPLFLPNSSLIDPDGLFN